MEYYLFICLFFVFVFYVCVCVVMDLTKKEIIIIIV